MYGCRDDIKLKHAGRRLSDAVGEKLEYYNLIRNLHITVLCLMKYAVPHIVNWVVGLSRSRLPEEPPTIYGSLVKKSITPPCHGGGHGFESRTNRQPRYGGDGVPLPPDGKVNRMI